MDNQQSSTVSFFEALRLWAKVGLLSFGGPAAQIALMHRLVVEEKKWVSEQRFLHALNYCMLLPGPEAQQLATFLGWALHRTRGALAAGLLFVLPGFVTLLTLSMFYASHHHTGWMAALFYGIKPAVLAVVLQAMVKLSKRAMKTRGSWIVACASFLALFLLAAPFPLVILTAACLGLLCSDAAPPATTPMHMHDMPSPLHTALVLGGGVALWLLPVLALWTILGPHHVFTDIGVFFSKMAVVTFGGAYSVLTYVAQQAVETYGWLTPAEMLDGLGMAETTPGPLIQVIQFVSYLAAYRNPGMLDPVMAGLLASLIVCWVTYVPCLLWIIAGAPYIDRLQSLPRLNDALSAITAAVVGVILNLSIWFAVHCLFMRTTIIKNYGLNMHWPVWETIDLSALMIALIACVMLFSLRLGMLTTLAVCTALGVILQLA